MISKELNANPEKEIEEVHEIFKYNLRLLRASAGISGKELAEQLKFKSLSRIHDLEEGRIKPRFEELVLIVDHFPITFDDLLDSKLQLNIPSRNIN